MKFFNSLNNDYGRLLRPNYQFERATIYLTSALIFILFMHKPPTETLSVCVAVYFACLGCFHAYCGWKLDVRQTRLRGVPLSHISVGDLANKIKNKDHAEDQWIGKGFIWEQRHTQGAFEILGTDYRTLIKDPYAEQRMGVGWIHGLEVDEIDLWQPLKHIEGHTLITGNPGTGKTRLFDLLINQCVQRGESVLIIDPKGDFDMRENARSACAAAGCEDRFVFFHPAFPEESIAINPLKNFNRTTGLASRISALLPRGKTSEAFTSFAWNTVDSICNGMLFCSLEPSLTKLRHYVERGVGDLVTTAIIKYVKMLDKDDPDGKYLDQLLDSLSIDKEMIKDIGRKQRIGTKSKEQITHLTVAFYRNYLEIPHPESAISGLVEIFEHDPEHYSKMIASLPPVLKMLTAGVMKDLLSPEEGMTKNQIFNMTEFINQKRVVYIGLDALSDSEVGHKIGSLLLADLASVAGERFNFVEPEDMTPVNIFVDEASEVLNEPFIQLLNKGRGAAMRLFVATQSISDFAATMGSKDRANQILGNINNKFALRTLDRATQDYLSESMPITRVKYVVQSHGAGRSTKNLLEYSNRSESRSMEKENTLFPPQLFSLLPNLEYVAFISGGITLKGRIPIVTREKEVTETEAKLEEEIGLEAESEPGQELVLEPELVPEQGPVPTDEVLISEEYVRGYVNAVLHPEREDWGGWLERQEYQEESLADLRNSFDEEESQRCKC